ncbi:hypothetical protein A2415_02940 [candidate division WWE3 bacterium RIFOXYC1_FULL_39_7]|uniref:Uncharacterized protein n=2 Tax=Katanobacteria TaxID=422282 RepID=A0A1F4X8F5_UNCKA|nr:MAG: hypothetical protein A2415_02940 [candidate division WWE3 bacterium RIFOXYC1_FULL_39_7]OGC77990.1 MAG: hypothetical protein A2619_02785 [candidate division WWE3 bacterium RIFOXYD1_FULL_39_9]
MIIFTSYLDRSSILVIERSPRGGPLYLVFEEKSTIFFFASFLVDFITLWFFLCFVLTPEYIIYTFFLIYNHYLRKIGNFIYCLC